MLVSPATGKMIHHNDCTYCGHRLSVHFKRKGRVREVEKCARTMGPLPEARRCDHYVQRGCGCDHCKSGVAMQQASQPLDKEARPW